MRAPASRKVFQAAPKTRLEEGQCLSSIASFETNNIKMHIAEAGKGPLAVIAGGLAGSFASWEPE
jgi:hypothetical protein